MAVITGPANSTPDPPPSSAALHAPRSRSVPTFQKSSIMATRKPKSPMRLTMNAFFPASALAFSLNQKPISR